MFDAFEFKRRYVDSGGSRHSANSYVSYLNRFDRCCGGINSLRWHGRPNELLHWGASQPDHLFGGTRERRDSLAAIRKYVSLMTEVPLHDPPPPAEARDEVRLEAIADLLVEARSLGARYYRLTGKPLGVTGEVAELAAAETLGVELAGARQAGFDGWLTRNGCRLRVQVKGRAVVPQ